jgi:hypothetical protein
MTRLTVEIKNVFKVLAEKYDTKVCSILTHGKEDEVKVTSEHEAVLLDKFAENIVEWVYRDYPDYEGKDKDINEDAQLVANHVPGIVGEYYKSCESKNRT